MELRLVAEDMDAWSRAIDRLSNANAQFRAHLRLFMRMNLVGGAAITVAALRIHLGWWGGWSFLVDVLIGLTMGALLRCLHRSVQLRREVKAALREAYAWRTRVMGFDA